MIYGVMKQDMDLMFIQLPMPLILLSVACDQYLCT